MTDFDSDRPTIRRRGMAVRRCFAALALCSLAAGCGYFEYEPLSVPDTDGFLLQPVSVTHDIHFMPDATKLSVGEKNRLQAFIDEIDPKDESKLWVEASGQHAKKRRSTVLHALEHLGRTDVGVGATQSRSNVISVTARRQVVLPKSCLDPSSWPDPRLIPASCANTLNLIATVENQSDLIQGREIGMASGSNAATALRELLAPGGGSPDDLSPASAPVTSN